MRYEHQYPVLTVFIYSLLVSFYVSDRFTNKRETFIRFGLFANIFVLLSLNWYRDKLRMVAHVLLSKTHIKNLYKAGGETWARYFNIIEIKL
jgi:hypothetical protein